MFGIEGHPLNGETVALAGENQRNLFLFMRRSCRTIPFFDTTRRSFDSLRLKRGVLSVRACTNPLI
jgi:hypothetical protein